MARCAPLFAAPLFASAMLLTSSPAFAWDWPEEPNMRQWRPDTIQWAQDIAWQELGESYTSQEIVELFDPPTREPWCVEDPAPTSNDCDVFDFRVRVWLRDFLGLAPNEALPPGLPQQPPECISICN